MGTKTSSTHHVYRQRSPLVMAVVAAAICALMLVSLTRNFADNPQPLFTAWVVFALALVWSVFVRPSVLIDDEGVIIRNVVRDVHIPWNLVTDVEYRWNLKVFTPERGYSAWAITAQVERPKGVTSGVFDLPGRLDKYASPGARAKMSHKEPKVTASSVARSIESLKDQYAEAVARGALPAAPDARVRVRWVPFAVVILLVPAIAVVALIVT